MNLFRRKHPDTLLLEQTRAALLQKEKELVEARTARTVISGEFRESRGAASRLRGQIDELSTRLLVSEVARATAEGRLGVVEEQNKELVAANKKLMDKCFVGMGFTPLWQVRVSSPVTPAVNPGEAGEPIKIHGENARDFTAAIQKMEDEANVKSQLELRQAIIRNMDIEVKEATTNGAGK